MMGLNINFDTEMDVRRATSHRVVETPVVEIQDTLETSRPEVRETRKTHLGREAEDWSWEQLRDYVVTAIEERFGEFPKDPLKLRGIFHGFHNRHGANAGLIAQAAFEVFDGYWKGAPISVHRFCKASDAWFAIPIKERLNGA